MDKDIPEALRRYANLNSQIYDFGPKFIKEKFKNPRESWENGFSDPRYHNEKSFRYLVYAFQSEYGESLQRMFILSHAIKNGPDSIGENIDLFNQPSRVKDVTLLSTSVIDDKKRRTFGSAGLLLSAPFENVLDMSHTDVGTNFAKPEETITRSGGLKYTLDQLTDKTSDIWHNEVRIKGKTESGEITVQGFWYKVNHKGEPLDKNLYEKMKYLSNLLKLPLISITEPRDEPHQDQKATITSIPERDRPGKDFKLVKMPVGIGVNRSGFRYYYNFKDRLIIKMDRDRKYLPVTESDYQFFKKTILAELSAEDLQLVEPQLSQMDKVYEESKKSK